MNRVRAFAPASIGNFAAGFDLLGAALAPLDGSLLGDVVELRPAPEPSFELNGPWAGALSGETRPNLVQRVVERYAAVLAERGLPCGPFAVRLEKRLPIASGLGSSASSIAATLAALQAACGHPLRAPELLALAGEAEGFYGGGPHLDNVAPALFGGLRLVVKCSQGIDSRALPWPESLRLVVVHPDLRVPTAQARACLPRELSLASAVDFAGNLAALVQALNTGDLRLLAASLRDPVAEAHRAPLVPGFREAQAAALEEGALGCSLSGSGPSVFVVAASDHEAAGVAYALQRAFEEAGLGCRGWICALDARGARLLEEA